MSSWLYLAGAIGFELIATLNLKLSDGLSRLQPTLIMVAGYLACFVMLARALKDIEVSVAYAIWSGIGTALIALAGIVLFNESINLYKVLSLGLIIVGVVGLHLAGKG